MSHHSPAVARTPSPALTAYNATSPVAMYQSGEHLFCIGSTDSGKGTFGLGPDAAQEAERLRTKAHRKAYWAEKEALKARRAAQDEASYARWQEEAKMTPRKRLAIVLAEREEQIQKEIKARKQWEEEFKRKQSQEASELADIFRHQREEFAQAQEEAREKRRQKTIREAEAVKLEEKRLIEAHAEEMRIVEEERRRHCEHLREIRRLERIQAQEAQKARFEKRCNEVKEIKDKQMQRVSRTKKTLEEIVRLKGQLTTQVKKEVTEAVEESRWNLEQAHRAACAAVIKEEEELLERKAKATAAELEKRKAFVVRLREEAKRCQEELEMHRHKQRIVLQQQAKEQRAQGRLAIEQEKEERLAAISEHINDARALIQKRVARHSPQRDRSTSPQ